MTIEAFQSPGMTAVPPLVDMAAPARGDHAVGEVIPIPSVEVSDVSMTFGSHVIFEDISLDVAPGEIVCIVGASGCGKTTLLRQIAGLQSPTSGTIKFDGELVRGPKRSRAIVFQDYGRALLPWRTVQGNIALGLEGTETSKATIERTVADLMRMTGLEAAARKYPTQLSGGMQQRVQIARSIAQSPHILLMDEPFGALDAMTRQKLQDDLLMIAGQRGVSVIFITHDLEEAIYLGDKVVALASNPGRILRTVPVDLPRPRDQLTTRESPRFLALRHELHALIGVH